VLYLISLVIFLADAVTGYITGTFWPCAAGSLIAAILFKIVVRSLVDARSGRRGKPGPYDIVPRRRHRAGS
jgi:hypothetical protein